MNRRESIKSLGAALATVLLGDGQLHAAASKRALTVYKSASCGCCGAWVRHMRANGFEVTEVNVNDLDAYKQKYGVPLDLASCHTGVVGEYAFEGHVPADLIERFLNHPPKGAQGLAVPGMPLGSPGMEVPGRKDAYAIMVFDGKGNRSVYARR
ncbi:MAG: DUF411 domain-containing protein [Gemmatimonadota bacterium]